MTGSLASLLQIPSDCGMKHVRHVPDFDVTHLLAGSLEDSLRIGQIRPMMEAEIDVVFHYADVTNVVFESVS